MDGATFLAYVEQVLAPTLEKGDIAFMDNLRTDKVDGVCEVVEGVGATVRYLLAYSPDLNPIEQALAKLKTALRKGAACTVKLLRKLIGKLVKAFAPRVCASYCRHAGGVGAVGNFGIAQMLYQSRSGRTTGQRAWRGDWRRVEIRYVVDPGVEAFRDPRGDA